VFPTEIVETPEWGKPYIKGPNLIQDGNTQDLKRQAINMTIATPSKITVHPFQQPKGSKVDFGAELRNVDLSNVTEADFDIISNALYNHQVVLIKNQSGVTPAQQYALNNMFDPQGTNYGHGKSLDAKRSILHPDLKTIPHQPQVQVIGNGFVPSYEGLENIKLKHPHHRTFHKYPIPEEEDLDSTRFYRWHIDAALYGLNPPKVTTLLAVSVPKGRKQIIHYDDTHEELEVPLGTTAFVSGYAMYNGLSPEEQEFVRTAKIQYAPHPYIWMSASKSFSDGLGLYSDNVELDASQLPPIEEEKIKIMPMVWRNPVTDRLALQIHPSAIQKIHLADGTVIDDLKAVRKIVHDLQRPAIAPERVYAHDWEEGDLILFNNWGVLHSVVGAFAEDEIRIFRQCNVAASEGPVGA
jgi:alpha-ketoglutarate-dependent taurine dioxygenase